MIGKVADPITRDTRKRTRWFLADVVGGEDIIVVLEQLPKCSRKEQILVPRTTITIKVNTSKPENEEKHREDGQPKGEEYFDDIKTAVFSSKVNKQSPLEDRVL